MVVTGVGVDALRHVRHTREYPLAALPVVLGTHLLVETFVWWGEMGQVPEFVGQAAVWLYLIVALGLLPALVPAAIIAVEPLGKRRRLMWPFVAVGGGLAALLLAIVITGPVGAQIQGCCLAYQLGPSYNGVYGAFYVIVTCLPLLASSHRRIVVFGAVNLVAVTLIGWLLASGLASLWCAWAAITSVLIATHLRQTRSKELAEAGQTNERSSPAG